MKTWFSRQLALRLQATFIFLMVCGGLFWSSIPAQAKSYYHPLIEQTIQINQDGSATVDEIRTFKFKGDFSYAYLRLGTKGEFGTYAIEYLGVWDEDSGKELRWSQTREGSEEVLIWHYKAFNRTKRFHLRYRIKYAVQCYRDVAQFYWKVIENEHARLDLVHTTLILPGASADFFKLFVHSKAKPGVMKFSEDMASVDVTLKKIPKTSFVEFRALFEPAVLVDPNIRVGEDRESLMEAEYKIAHPGFAVWLQEHTVFISKLIPFLVLALLYAWIYFSYGTEPKVKYDREYEREAPRDLPPAVVSAILSQGDIDATMVAQGFSATLLEAGRLGYLTVKMESGEDEEEVVYRLTPKGEELLRGNSVGRKEGERRLEKFEVDVLKIVFQDVGGLGYASQYEIRMWARKMEGGKSRFLNFVESWGLEMRSWFEQHYFQIDVKASEEAKEWFKFVPVVVFVFYFIWSHFHGMDVYTFFVIVAAVVLGSIGARFISRRTPKAALEVRRWEAFKKFLTDFSAMEDARETMLPMWEKYLVWAAALGVAPKLIMNLNLAQKSELSHSFTSDWMFLSCGEDLSYLILCS